MKIKPVYITLGIVALLLVILCGMGCSSYNGMVTLEERADQAWANVQNQYQRRADLIPNLEATVNAATQNEKAGMAEVTKMRTGYNDLVGALDSASAYGTPAPGTPEATAQAAAQRRVDEQYRIYINAVHEAYPNFQFPENFAKMQDELAGTENRVSTERTRYNEAVKEYNIKVRRFPANIFAAIFGFDKKEQFSADAGAQSAPKVFR